MYENQASIETEVLALSIFMKSNIESEMDLLQWDHFYNSKPLAALETSTHDYENVHQQKLWRKYRTKGPVVSH